MAATDLVFTGLSYAIGRKVEVVIGGLDCGQFLVAAGGVVTVPLASNALLSGTYLQSLDVGPYDKLTYGDATTQVTMQIGGGGRATMYVPVTIGYVYQSLGQLLRPNAEAATKSPAGGATGKLRRVWSYGALLSHSQGVSFGTGVAALTPAPFQFNNGISYPPNLLFDGVVYGTIEDSDTFDGMLCWSIPGPYPFIMLSLTSFIETHERQ